jgi:predicted AlkP superfamily phosphohydrolase/phosphomutase
LKKLLNKKSNRKPKVILIGIDGATWNLINPLIKQGNLPMFKKLINNGAWGNLESTMPPVTFPAWQSLFTGLNPGKLGVYDFVQVDISNKKYTINSPNSFKNKQCTLWNILSKFGYSNVIINVPTAKVQKINGIMIGGAFSFNDYVYPNKFVHILKKFGYKQYPLELTKSYINTSNNVKRKDYLKNIEKIVKEDFNNIFRIAKYTLNVINPDFLAFIIFSIDNIQHFFWKEDIVKNLWIYLDQEIRDFYNCLDEDTYLILCSDHGFIELKKTFYISKYLEHIKYFKIKKNFKQNILNFINREKIIHITKRFNLYNLARKMIPTETLISILSNFPDKEGRTGIKNLEKIIDWEHSKCIPISSEIYLNCSENEKNQIINSLIKNFEHLESDGEKIIEHIYRKEELYNGKYLNLAPDLVLNTKEGIRIRESYFVDKILDKNIQGPWRAVHKRNGIFLAIGPNIKKSFNYDIKIYDIAPTILHLFDLPKISEIDGNVLFDIFQNYQGFSKNYE